MFFRLVRKFAGLFGIQILKVSTYNRLVKNLTSEYEANAELSNSLIQSLHKEQYQTQKARLLIQKINGLKKQKNKSTSKETAYLLDISSLTKDALDAAAKGTAIPKFFLERTNTIQLENFKTLYEANAKASEAIDFLQSKYVSDINLDQNAISIDAGQSESRKLFEYNINLKREAALASIVLLNTKYSNALQDSKYYE